MFGFNNDRLFPDGRETVKDHISNTKPEKGDNYCIQTRGESPEKSEMDRKLDSYSHRAVAMDKIAV